jgi:hypothetical protein
MEAKNIFFIILIGLLLAFNFSKGQNNKVVLEAYEKETPFLHFYGKHPAPRINALYFEAFGNSANLYSVNYERCISLRKLESGKWIRCSIRLGVNYFEKAAIPMMFHISRGLEYCFEAGAGWVPWFSSEKRVDGIAVFSGFRYQPKSRGLMARFAITPTYLIQESDHWRMLVGFSSGWAF